MRLINVFVGAHLYVFMLSIFVKIPGGFLVISIVSILAFGGWATFNCWKNSINTLDSYFLDRRKALFGAVTAVVILLGIIDRQTSHGGAALKHQGYEYVSVTKGLVIYRFKDAREFHNAVKIRRCLGSGVFLLLSIFIAGAYDLSLLRRYPPKSE